MDSQQSTVNKKQTPRYFSLCCASGATQMAIDHWLLQKHRFDQYPPMLRFYTWSPATISLGYHQRNYPEHWHNLTWEGKPIEIVRRPTGGRAVLHQGDLTYMIIVPSDLGGLKGKKTRSQVYQKLCQFLIDGWQKLGISLHYGTAKRGYIHHPSCFSTATAADLVTETGEKLIGSAQLRQGKTILQHGSIILNQNPQFYETVFGEKPPFPSSIQLSLETIINTLLETFQDHWGIVQTKPFSLEEWQQFENFLP